MESTRVCARSNLSKPRSQRNIHTICRTILITLVNRRLQSDQAFAVFRENYRHVEITRPTVIAALRALRRANS
jgi:hypothetical protein